MCSLPPLSAYKNASTTDWNFRLSALIVARRTQVGQEPFGILIRHGRIHGHNASFIQKDPSGWTDNESSTDFVIPST
ncbi:MAG: hypothetical protein PHD25_03065 [Bacteroidales bacterium]|nr:hypothetical protein [Bacteroidales bacterium]